MNAAAHRADAVAFCRSAAAKQADARSMLKLLEILEADPATYCRSNDYLEGVRARLLLVVAWMRADSERDQDYADTARAELGKSA